jgi:hypothetical protein
MGKEKMHKLNSLRILRSFAVFAFTLNEVDAYRSCFSSASCLPAKL